MAVPRTKAPFETDFSILGCTEHIPVRVESFELKIGELYVDGEAFMKGGLILDLYNILKMRKIPAGMELTLDDKMTKLLISNEFDDFAVEKIWKWYSDPDIRVECDRQTLPKPTAPDSTQDLETVPQSGTTPESTITPLEPEQTLPKPTAPDSTQDLETVPESGTTPESTITPLEPEQTLPKPTAPDSTQDVPESASTTPESTITPLEPELEILPVSPPEPELEILPVSPPEPELEILPITQ